MFPVDFIHSLEIYFGEERVRRLISALAGEPSLSVRANPAKISAEKLAEHFSDDVDGIVPWCPEGLYLKKRPSFTLIPCFTPDIIMFRRLLQCTPVCCLNGR